MVSPSKDTSEGTGEGATASLPDARHLKHFREEDDEDLHLIEQDGEGLFFAGESSSQADRD